MTMHRQIPSPLQRANTLVGQPMPNGGTNPFPKTVYLVVGCPGSGKSWVCDKLKDLFEYVHHDLFIGMEGQAYVDAILAAAAHTHRPLLTEAPFSIEATKGPLESAGLKVVPVVIQENREMIARRYFNREGREIPPGHLTRQGTYALRAKNMGWFAGTTEQVLDHLKEKAAEHHRERGTGV